MSYNLHLKSQSQWSFFASFGCEWISKLPLENFKKKIAPVYSKVDQ